MFFFQDPSRWARSKAWSSPAGSAKGHGEKTTSSPCSNLCASGSMGPQGSRFVVETESGQGWERSMGAAASGSGDLAIARRFGLRVGRQGEGEHETGQAPGAVECHFTAVVPGQAPGGGESQAAAA